MQEVFGVGDRRVAGVEASDVALILDTIGFHLAWGREVLWLQVQRPGGFWPWGRFVSFLEHPHVAHAHAAFFFHHETGTRKRANGAMAGAIAEELTAVTGFLAREGIKPCDGADDALVGGIHLHSVNGGVEEEV